MATVKKRILIMSSGKQIRLSGHCLCIANTLEVGEGYTKNILSINEAYKPSSGASPVLNPYELTKDELYDIADYNILRWMMLKDNVRLLGLESPDIFKKSI